MNRVKWLLVCGAVTIALGGCAKKESSEESGTAAEESAPAAAKVSLAGTWEVTSWMADHVNQLEMWGIQNLTVTFNEDGTSAASMVYNDGEERSSHGTWETHDNHLHISVQADAETEGDEPFERTRDFTIEQLTEESLSVHAEIGPEDKPIRLAYTARRMPMSGDADDEAGAEEGTGH